MACAAPAGQSGSAEPSASAATAAPTESADPSPDATSGAIPTEAPTPEPTEAAAATEEPNPCRPEPWDGPFPIYPLVPASAIRITVAELNVRDGPCIAARKLGSVPKGKVAILDFDPYGPVRADGYAWYSVHFVPNSYPRGTLPDLPESPFPDGTDHETGWIAAFNEEEAYVERMRPRCPTTVDLKNVVMMIPSEWLACFDEPIVLEGSFGCGGCGGAGGPISEPTWLANAAEYGNLRVEWAESQYSYRPITLHFKPTGPEAPKDGSIIRVKVHLDDPASQDCTFTWALDDPVFVVPGETAVAWCRQRFVVDSYTVLGTDPNYP
jgi:hypothetical protein